jgi:hypothetical protein
MHRHGESYSSAANIMASAALSNAENGGIYQYQ